MKSILCLLACCGICQAELADVPALEMPPIVAKAKGLRFTETEAELAALAPGAGKPEPSVGDDSTQAKETIKLLGTKMNGEYEFQKGILFSWAFMTEEIEIAKGIPLSQAIAAEFERRFGPAVRSFSFPDESDGPRNRISMQLQWPADHGDLFVGFEFNPEKCRVAFGSVTTFSHNGNRLQLTGSSETLRGELITERKKRIECALGGDPETLFLLKELAKRGITGRLGNEPLQLPDCGQEIVCYGEFVEKERLYKVGGLTVIFPLTVKRSLPNGASFSEMHQGMDSLFPDGLSFEGKKIDLKALEEWRDAFPKYR